MFPSRDQVVAYLEDYARDNELEIRFRTRVERLEPHGGGWRLETSTGELTADHVVVADGLRAHASGVPSVARPRPLRGRG